MSDCQDPGQPLNHPEYKPESLQVSGDASNHNDEDSNVEDKSNIDFIKATVQAMQEELKTYIDTTKELKQSLLTQAQIHHDSIKGLREHIQSIQLDRLKIASEKGSSSSIQGNTVSSNYFPFTSIETTSASKATPEPIGNNEKSGAVTHPNSKSLPIKELSFEALIEVLHKIETKIDNLNTEKSNDKTDGEKLVRDNTAYHTIIEKIAPDNMPGPRNSNNLLILSNLQIQDLSCVDTPQYEDYVKSLWPHALSCRDVDDNFRLDQNTKQKFYCFEQLKDARKSNWRALYNIQRALFSEMTPYKHWPSRIIGNLSGDFSSVATFILFKKPTWLLVLEAILIIMRSFKGLQPPISEIASMTKFNGERDYIFLCRLRRVFNQMPSAMAENPVTLEVLSYTLRKCVPKLWARVESRVTSKSCVEALENTLELAAVKNSMLLFEDGSIFSKSAAAF